MSSDPHVKISSKRQEPGDHTVIMRQSQKEALKFLRPDILSTSPEKKLHMIESKCVN